MMKDNNWIKSLKDKVEDGSTLPKPTVSWEKLEGEMDRIARRRKVWKVVGGVCATAAAVLCAFLLIDRPQETNGIHIIGNEEVVTTAESISHSEQHLRISSDEPSHSAADSTNTSRSFGQSPQENESPRHSARSEKSTQMSPVILSADEEAPRESDTTQKESSPSAQNEEQMPIKKTTSATDSTNTWRSFGQSPQDENLRHSERQRRISLGFGSDLSRLTGAVVRGGDKISSAVGASPSWGNNYSEDVVFPNISGDNAPTIINNPVTLNKIISVGLYAKYGFSENFFAAGGLELTYYTTAGKDLLYLGPSIGIGYDIYKNYKVDIYASISGLPEWCLSSGGYPALISTSLTAGAQFRLGNITWIALEPQLRYYAYTGIDNKVSMRQPLCFSFNLGFRFDL